KSRRWQQENRARRRKGSRIRRLMTEYGITEDFYRAMLEKQRHLCAICGKPFPSDRERCVDHCHKTGQVRGILCGVCNRNLGILEVQDGLWASSAAAYLNCYRDGCNTLNSDLWVPMPETTVRALGSGQLEWDWKKEI